MANKRDLKKHIMYVCGDIAAECIFSANCIDGVDSEKMLELVGKVAVLQVNSINHSSFSFDKMPSDYATRREYRSARRAYFKKAYASFSEKFLANVNEIVSEMNAALPQSVKDAKKKH